MSQKSKRSSKSGRGGTRRCASRRGASRRSGSATLSDPQDGISTTVKAVVIVAILVLAALYMATGHDPLGLFSAPDVTPPAAVIGDEGNWWQVFFTAPENVKDPEDLSDSISVRLIAHIEGAQRTIHIAAFEFDLEPVAEALIAARERDVQVQWVTDDTYGIEADEDDGHDLFPRLKKAGIKVKDDDRTALMHNKFWVFDGQTVWTGSTNITANGSFRNNNNAIVIAVPEVAAMYEREFAEMWKGQFGPTSPSTVDDQRVIVSGTPVEILFAAEDDVIERLVPLVQSAQSSIRFMAFSFTHDEIGKAMLARAKAGVDVQGIFETRGSETEYSELRALYCGGLPVRQDGNPGTFHHKVIVIDDQTVVTGSLNFSENADESNDENVVVVTNPEIAARYLEEFERRWAEGRVPDSAAMRCK